MSAIEEDVPSPLCNDVADGLDGKRKLRHRGSQCDHFGAHQWGDFAKEVEVNFKLDRIKWDIYDLQTAYTGWSVDAVAGMPSTGLRTAQDDVTVISQRCIAR